MAIQGRSSISQAKGVVIEPPDVIWGCITQLFSPKDAPLPTMTSIFLLDKLISIGKYNTY